MLAALPRYRRGNFRGWLFGMAVSPGSATAPHLGSLTQPPLPAAPATVAMSLFRLPSGAVPPPGEVRLFATEPRDDAWLRSGVDGLAKNVGDHEITAYPLSVAPTR